MKQILNRPLLLSFILSLPLWVVFHNYIVALIVALLLGFLLSMLNSLRLLHSRKGDPSTDTRSKDTE